MTDAITQTRLKELLDYNPETGVFTWRVRRAHRNHVGDVTGTSLDRHGYGRIGIDNKVHSVHRLAFLWMTGEIPAIIDHINGDRSDNRFSNLRPASPLLNSVNRKRASTNKSGFKGVSPYKDRWRATLNIRGHRTVLGYFETPELAHEAYKRESIAQFGEYARFE